MSISSVGTTTDDKRDTIASVINKKGSMEAMTILPTNRLAQNHLVLRLLNECVVKLKLSTIIPTIFENPITVYTCLKGTEYECCATALFDYLRGRDKDEELDVGGPPFFDNKLITLIHLFHHNYKVMDLLPNWFNDATSSDQAILEAFDLLTAIVETRIHRSAIIEIKREKEMHSTYRENTLVRKEMEYMTKKLRWQKQRQRWRRVLYGGNVLRYKDELTAKLWSQSKSMDQVMQENAIRIKTCNFGYMNKINQLEDEANAVENEYQKIKEKSGKELKAVREEKNKLLIQLQNTIERHDRLLGEKIKENVYLQDEYDKKKEEMDAFMLEYNVLEKEYNDIIAEEKEEEERKWRTRANFFFQTRAVRIIQRYWREYLQAIGKARPQKKSSAKGKSKGRKRK